VAPTRSFGRRQSISQQHLRSGASLRKTTLRDILEHTLRKTTPRHLPRQHRKEARLTRRRIEAPLNARPEHVARAPFDPVARGYEYHVARPEPGYFYSPEWDR
jgi:hypothetical protein